MPKGPDAPRIILKPQVWRRTADEKESFGPEAQVRIESAQMNPFVTTKQNDNRKKE
jgi:hypothetical protein